jgi:hypothetical protein
VASYMNGPEQTEETRDTLGAPDSGGPEDELGGPDPSGGRDDLGGPDPAGPEDELAVPAGQPSRATPSVLSA